MGKRRKSREIALQALYMFETNHPDLSSILDFSWLEEETTQETIEFSEKLVRETIQNISEIDDIIKRYAKNWKFDRIETIDKTVLRMSIYSLLFQKDIPAPVTINEGIELAKLYGGENSGTFVNGILDAVRKNEL